MPEATIKKDGNAVACEYDIGPHSGRVERDHRMPPETQTTLPQG